VRTTKRLPTPLVKDSLGPDTRIGAADNDRKWVLAFGYGAAGFGDFFWTSVSEVA
jgi:hypothetical protein